MEAMGNGILPASYGHKDVEYYKQVMKQVKNRILMPPHHLTNFEIQRYY